MAEKSLDSFGTRTSLKSGNQSYDIFRLDKLEKTGFKNVSRLPVSLKVLLENLLRLEDNHHVSKQDVETLANRDPKVKRRWSISPSCARR
jgi:aconitate hydratase